MIRLGRTLGVFFLSTALLACSPRYIETDQPDATSIPDREIGLVKGSVFDVADPDPVHENTADPGDGSVLPRPFVGAPPRVSHSLADMLPITRQDNLCIDCHLIEEAGEGDPPPIPQSHLVDLRNAPDVVGNSVAGARHNCTTCHVPRTDARPLVGVWSGPPTQ